MYKHRELLDKITLYFQGNRPRGLILSGIVGSGKTTLVEELIKHLPEYEVFTFTGDDSQFRNQVAENTNYFKNHIVSRTSKKTFIYVDEVQKSEAVFDALKIAHDQLKASFIVTGSNPAYLSTAAKRRLQRRADQFLLLPFSLGELFVDAKLIDKSSLNQWDIILESDKKINYSELRLPTMTKEMEKMIFDYFKHGGLPLSVLSEKNEEKRRHARMTIERGFELMSVSNNSIADSVRIELANLHSREFAYKNILEKTRQRQRASINEVIDELMNHGYLVKKKPILFGENKSTYLTIFSYTDAGIVNYLLGDYEIQNRLGFLAEGYVHSRLAYKALNSTLKSEVCYYKPHQLDSKGNIRYLPGEVDFIYKTGKRILPIEVKATFEIGSIDTNSIETLLEKQSLSFGVVLYFGLPHFEKNKKILFWPIWLI